ncbi:MAG: diguanylate cyclase [Alphaproteobacteria bacterium]|nr:diguanylate cyclase [Alphaproteobacteria bacterium]
MVADDKNITAELEHVERVSQVKSPVETLELGYGNEINLEALEELQQKDKTAMMKQREEGFSEFVLLQNFIGKMNLKLQEVIDKVFEKSPSYCVVVRDDKIIYANNSFINLVECDDLISIYNKKFFKFIHKEDWALLAENIGEMLTNNVELKVRVNTIKDIVINVNFRALLIQDGKHFTFALFGSKIYSKRDIGSVLYDINTGLPSYYLFEDRLQVAINHESRKAPALRENIAVLAVYLDNLEEIKEQNNHIFILRRIAEKLALGLDKSYTIATGIENQFWLIIPRYKKDEVLKSEIRKIVTIFEETINDGNSEHDMVVSIGVGLYPRQASTFTKLMEITTRALKKAQTDGGNKVVFISE